MMKDIRVLGHSSEFSVKADRQKMPPWGLFGGKPGLPGQIIMNPDTSEAVVIDSKKSGTPRKENGVLRCRMPGAGGYGDPLERERDKVIYDLEEGYISPESAVRDYGMTKEELKKVHVFQG